MYTSMQSYAALQPIHLSIQSEDRLWRIMCLFAKVWQVAVATFTSMNPQEDYAIDNLLA